MRFIKDYPVLAASTDAIRYTLRRVIKEADEPDLFHLGKYTSNDPERRQYLKSNSLDVVDVQNKESAIVWRSAANFIESNIEDGYDVLIEGIAVLPSFVQQLQCDYSAVFMGNRSDEHFQTILSSARANHNDWMHSLEDETIEAFAIFNQKFSKYIEQEAINYGMTYVEVHENDFEADIQKALAVLLH